MNVEGAPLNVAIAALEKALAAWKAVLNATATPAWRPPPPVPEQRTPEKVRVAA